LTIVMQRRARNLPSRAIGSLLAVAVIGMLVVGSSGWLAFRLLNPGQQRTVDRSSPTVLQAIHDLSAYKAASGNFQVLVDLEKDVKLLPSAIAGERSLMVAQGSVDAEVDFSQLGADAVHVSPDRRSVAITLPAAQLSATHLDHDRTYVAERQRGLLNRIGEAISSNPGDDQQLLQAADQKLQAAAQGTELRQKAEDNTRSMLTGLLNSLGYEHVTVTFQAPPRP
jgi:hypothetical protein